MMWSEKHFLLDLVLVPKRLNTSGLDGVIPQISQKPVS